jgi:predicted MFS family arabinose efflux permease
MSLAVLLPSYTEASSRRHEAVIHIGMLTAIMIGVPLLAQLGFAGYLHGRPRKKPFLMMGIHVRVAALAGAAVTITASQQAGTAVVIGLLYLWMLLFSMSGAFAGISYTDIVGRAVPAPRRREFFVLKQTLAALGVLAAALIGRVILARLSYPSDYRMMFLSAAAALLVATVGFWVLNEPNRAGGSAAQTEGSAGDTGPGTSIRGGGNGSDDANPRPRYWDIMRSIPAILRDDQTLRNYILASNLLGLGVTLVPFYVASGRNRAGLTTEDVGTLLLVQIVAMVASNVLWSKVAARWGFKGVVRWLILIAAAGPFAALALATEALAVAFPLIFLLSGSAHSADHIARDAVLIEISTDENRALYSGIFGTLNLTRAVFPVASGALLAAVGYDAIFIAVGVVSLAALSLLRGMVCPVDRVRL